MSKHLLLKNFANVELVDVTANFVATASAYLGEADAKRVLKFHCSGLESFHPEVNRYDCIWIQWVTGYLNDGDLVDFLRRCKTALRASAGICVLKENVAQADIEWDETDSSATRTRQHLLNLIHKAGMHVVRDEKQKKFPAELYEVRLFAFR